MPTLVPSAGPFDDALLPLETGGFVRVHYTETLITLDRFDATGALTQANVRVAGNDPGTVIGATFGTDVVVLANGHIGVFWAESFTASGLERIYFRELNPDGSRGPATRVFNGTPESNTIRSFDDFSAAVLKDGTIVATADYAQSGGGEDDRYFDSIVVEARFTPGQQAVATTGIGTLARDTPVDVDGSVAALKGGGHVVVYREFTPTDLRDVSNPILGHLSAYDVVAQLYDANGAAGARIVVGSGYEAGALQVPAYVVALGNGGFAVTYTAGGETTGAVDINGRPSFRPAYDGGTIALFDADGARTDTILLPPSLVAETAYGTVFNPVATILPVTGATDGGFFVLGEPVAGASPYNPHVTGTDPGTLNYVYVDGTGAVSGVQSVSPPPPAGTPTVIGAIGITPEGRIAVGVVSQTGSGASLDFPELTYLYDPRGSGEHFVGDARAETYVGTPYDDTIEGGGGFDTLAAGAGDDVVALGPVFTGGRFDFSGSFSADGGPGRDTLDLTAFRSTVADSENGTRETGPNFVVDLAAGTVSVGGTVVGSAKGFEVALLGPGNDRVTGTDGADSLVGGDGNDRLIGGAGADTLVGGAGSDRLIGGPGDDVLQGGAGHDVADYSSAAGPVRVDLGAHTAAGEGTDVLFDVEEAVGSAFADRLAAGADGATLTGGNGADTLVGGDGDDRLSGGAPIVADVDFTPGAAIVRIVEAAGDTAGNLLTGGAGNDTIFGATGDDTIDAGTGTDVVFAGGGNDRVAARGPDDAVDPAAVTFTYLNAGSGSDTIEVLGGRVKIAGGDGDDLVVLHDLPRPGAADDPGVVAELIARTLYGEAGVDTLDLHFLASGVGGAGHGSQNYDITTIKSGDGGEVQVFGFEALIGTEFDDLLSVGILHPDETAGHRIEGRGGDDTIVGDGFGDTLMGGDGLDAITGGAGADSIDGGAGADTIEGGLGDDTIDGGLGDDIIQAGGDDDLVHGGAGGDIIEGGVGRDELFGDADADVLRGDVGDDTLHGGAGDDTLIGGGGNDDLFGDDGRDLADFAEAAGPLTLDLAAGTYRLGSGGTGEGGLIAGVEDATGTALADRLSGDAGANLLQGGAGNDTLVGGGGDDTLSGGAGDDLLRIDAASGSLVLSGGEGRDTADFSALHGPVHATGLGDVIEADGLRVAVQDDVEAIVGTASGDDLEAFADGQTIDGGAGDDFIRGASTGRHGLVGGAGRDTVVYEGLEFAISVDLAAGTATAGAQVRDSLSGFEAAVGGHGNDTLVGSGNDDGLEGGDGNDLLQGREGNDTLEGGAGADTLDGGAGADLMFGGAGRNTYVVDDPGDRVGSVSADDRIILDTSGLDGVQIDMREVAPNVHAVEIRESVELYGGAHHAGALDIVLTNGDDTVDFPAFLRSDAVIEGGGGIDTIVLAGRSDQWEVVRIGDGYLFTALTELGPHTIEARNFETVTFRGGLPPLTGRVVDGYLAGALVWGDADGDGRLGPGEVSTTTDAGGAFTLVGASGRLAATGGTDVSTGLPFAGLLTAPAGSSVVTPLTTLVEALAEGGVADPEARVKAALGLPASLDLLALDPVAASGAGDAGALAALRAAATVAATLALVSAGLTGAGATDAAAHAGAVAALAAYVAGHGETDLTSAATVTAVAAGAGLSVDAADTVGAVAAASNVRISASVDAGAVASAQGTAQGDAAAAIQAAGTDPARLAAVDAAFAAPHTGLADVIAPNAPTVSLLHDTGLSATDHLTSDASLAIAPAESGGTLAYGVDGGAFAASYDPRALADGSHTVAVTQTDAAGNVSVATSVGFVLDTHAPTLSLARVSGAGNLVDGHVLTGVFGLVGPGAADAGLSVTIRDGTTVLGTATSDAEGHFSLALPDAGDGPGHTYALTASATDAAGNTGASDSFAFALDFTPNQGLFGTVAHDAGSHAGQVHALYEGLVGHAFDALGAEAWTDALDHGASLRQVTLAMLSSPEARARLNAAGNAEYVEQVYATVLGRASDPVGKAAWADSLEHGLSRVDLVDAFVFGSEHLGQLSGAYQAGVYVADATEAAVARLYYGLLDRAPDADGLRGWSAAAHAGVPLTSMAQAGLDGSEYQATHAGQTDAEFVAGLYAGALGRTPEAGEVQAWVDGLSHGLTRAGVAVAISEGAEARAHLAGQIEEGWHLA